MLLPAALAWAGPIVIAGLDPEDHGPDGVAVIHDLQHFVVSESTRSPNPTRILQLGGSGGPIGASLTDAAVVASSLGYNLTLANGTNILSVNLAGYDAIYMPCNERDLSSPKGFYGLLRVEIGYINQRASDIRAFVNGGGGILAFAQNEPNGFGWFPLGQLQTRDFGFGGITGIMLTPEGATILNEMQLVQVQPFHQSFLGPAGFFGLHVLAKQIDAPMDPVILGGRSACIGPFLVLAPANDTNPVCTPHTLTAVATGDVDDCSPIPSVTVTFTVLSGPNAGVNGQAVTDANGSCAFTYTGNGGPGTDSIQASYISPRSGNTLTSNIATKTWVASNVPPTIDQANSPPNLNVFRNSTCPSAANQVNLTATDPDSASSLSWSVFTAPTKGVVSFVGGTTGAAVTACYQPNSGQTGADSFAIKVFDGCDGMATITIPVNILVPNEPPVITEGDTFAKSVNKNSVCPNVPNRVTLNATDADGPLTSLVWSVLTPPVTGTVSILSTTPPGRVVLCYAPNSNQSAPDSFVVKVSDAAGGMDTIIVNVTVVNQPPLIAQGAVKNITVNQDSTCADLANLVTLNATDADDNATALNWTIQSPPATGTASFTTSTNGSAVTVCYQPNPGQSAADSFVVRVTDGSGGFAQITINVTVTPASNCPSITQPGPIAVNVSEDSNCGGAGNTFTLSATDPDTPLSSLTWSATSPTKGAVSFPNGATGGSVQICYTPAANATGSDSFVVSVSDGNVCSGSSMRTVNVVIAAVNDCPSINQGATTSITVVEDSSCAGAGNTFALSGSDPDSPAGSLTWSSTSPAKGVVSFPNGNTGGSVMVCYAPNADQTGSDSFVVSVDDGASCTGGSKSITVNVTITPVADCPTITEGSATSITVAEDSTCGGTGNTFTLNATDPDSAGGSLLWSATSATKGSVSFPGGNAGSSVQVCYTPNLNQTGSDSFTVSVADGSACSGGLTSITVSVTITPVADCPTITEGAATTMTVLQNSTCAGTGNQITLNATDPDSVPAALSWSSTTPSKGSVSFPNGTSGAGVSVCYTPNTGELGADSFVVSVTDGGCGGSGSITVSVTITPFQCPTITQGSQKGITVAEDSNCGGAGNTFTLSATDPDTPLGSLSWSSGAASKGTVTFPGGNTGGSVQVCYVPNADQSGSDSFVVSVQDGACGGTTSITINVTITPIADCPTITGSGLKSITVAEDSTCGGAGNTFTVAATDPDTPAGSLTWSKTSATKGTVSFPGGNTGGSVQVCYTPNANQTGSDSFMLSVSDGGACTGGNTSITVSVTITPINDCPAIAQGPSISVSVIQNSTCGGLGNTFVLSATDPDSPGSSFSWSSTTPAKGSVNFPNGNTGSIVQVCYTPTPGQLGPDSFVINVTDGNGGCPGAGGSITVNVTINPFSCPVINQGSQLNINVEEDSNCGGTGNTFMLSATDPDSLPGSLSWSHTSPSMGTVSFPGGSTGASVQVCYAPNADANGGDSFVVSVQDGNCGSVSSITINVTLVPVTDCPVITQGMSIGMSLKQNSTCGDAGNTIALSATDVDSPAGSLAWSTVSAPTKGAVSFPSGTSGTSVQVCYTPNTGQVGSDSFSIRVTDGTCNGEDSIMVSVTINPLLCPTINEGSLKSITVAEDSDCGGVGNSFALSATDPDSPIGSLTWSNTTPSKGSVSFPNGTTGGSISVCYTPNPNADGSDSFVISVSDGNCGGSGAITVNVTITPSPDCPVITQGSVKNISVNEDSLCGDTGNTFTLSATDPDTPAGSLIWTPTAPTKGSITFPSGSSGASVQVCYRPGANQVGSDSFMITVSDGQCSTSTITINVTIVAIEDCPAITQGSTLNINVAEDSTCGGAGNTFALSASDPDTPAGSLAWSNPLAPAKGSVSFPGGTSGAGVDVCYTPNADATGSDSFVIRVADGSCPGGGTNITVNVTIASTADCPTITQGPTLGISVGEDSACGGAGNSFTLTATDPDTPAGSLTWSAIGSAKGSVSFPGGNTGASILVCYTPNADATGNDSFVVSVSDGGACFGGSASVTVNVSISSVEDCPRITQPGPIAVNVQEDSSCGGGNTFVLNATDPDSPIGSLNWSHSAATKGTVSFVGGNTGGSVTICYVPNPNANGSDSFTVSVSDGTACSGSQSSVVVNVNILAVPDCPSIAERGAGISLTVEEDSGCGSPANTFSLNATDPDTPAGSLSWSATGAVNGVVSFPNGNAGSSVIVCYTPKEDFNGGDSFVVHVSDGGPCVGGTSSINVSVNITPVLDCPTITQIGPIQVTVQEDSPCGGFGNTFTLDVSDPDTPAGSLTWSSTTPSLGSVSFPNGNTGTSVAVCYTPNIDATGSDVFDVFVSDGTKCNGGRTSVTVQVTINTFGCPVITEGSLLNLTVNEDSLCAANTLMLHATDSDTPAGSLNWTFSTNPTRGAASFVGGSSGGTVQVCYAPNANEVGNDTFVITVADGQCGQANVTINVTITPQLDCPTIEQAGPISITVAEDSDCGGAGNSFALSATDPDTPLPSLTWSATGATKGVVSFVGGNVGGSVNLCYTPNPDADGADSFTVHVTDGDCAGGTSIVVNVTITPSADCPIINQLGPIELAVDEDSICGGMNSFMLSAIDPDTPAGSLVWNASGAMLGTVTFPAGNTGASVEVCYTPDLNASGSDSFVISVSDGGGCEEGSFIVVNVTVNPVNDCPDVIGGEGGTKQITVQRNSTCGGAGNTFTLSATDVEGDPIFWMASMPAKGTVSFVGGKLGETVQVCYTPNSGATGADAFLVTPLGEDCSEPQSIVVNVGIHCGEVSGDCNGNGIPDNCEIADNAGADRDGDGILNSCDACPDDAANDADGDGVCGNVDQCPNTPPGTPVDASGCPAACPDGDSDNDGVCNSADQCPNTPPGTPVDASGCPQGGGGQSLECRADDDDTLNLLMSVLFRAPVCGCGIMLTGLFSFLGIIGLKASHRRLRRRASRGGRSGQAGGHTNA